MRPQPSAVTEANHAGVQFIDPVEIISCDTHGCDYYNIMHDVGLRIPEEAIPPSEGRIDIEFGVAMYGPFRLADEKSVRRVSPLYGFVFSKMVFKRVSERCGNNHPTFP